MRRLALCAAAIAIGVSAVASAHDASYKSTVKIKEGSVPDGARFSGTVKSKRDACIKKRKVRLFVNDSKAGPQPVGSARSDRKGEWVIDTTTLDDDPYQAKVTRNVTGGKRHRHVCRKDKSNLFQLEA